MTSSHQSSAIANFFRRPSFLQEVVPNSSDFEFDESDLYFDSSKPKKASKVVQRKMKGSAKVAAAAEESSRSVPVRIPEWSARMQAESEGSDGEEDERRVPPHEYLARKRGASLSVHEGAGRTLKGRDMSRVRNAVWKRIGFED